MYFLSHFMKIGLKHNVINYHDSDIISKIFSWAISEKLLVSDCMRSLSNIPVYLIKSINSSHKPNITCSTPSCNTDVSSKSREQKDRCVLGTFHEKWRCCELWASSLCCLSRILPLICLQARNIVNVVGLIVAGPKIPSTDYLSWAFPILNVWTWQWLAAYLVLTITSILYR